MAERSLLSGWGRTAATAADVRVVDAASVADAVVSAGSRGLIARGLGRSYGDAAQNAGGLVVELGHETDEIHVDPETASASVTAGVSLDKLMRELLPLGYFVPVTPGTRYVTVGGAIAADIHGKNHHVDGSLGRHLQWIELVDGTGSVRRLDPTSTPDEFWATTGGMGLTGVITRACIALRPVMTSFMRVDTGRASDLDAVLGLMELDDAYTYSVAWVDLLSTGRSLGRSVLTRGEHATPDELPRRLRDDPLAFAPSARLSAPRWVPNSAMNPWSVRAFNELWYRKSPRRRVGQVTSLASFFHPLDGVRDWNRMYGNRGFVQYQLVVPLAAVTELRQIVQTIATSGHAPFLAVLKRFGDEAPGPLSFPLRGWTLALDLPATPGLGTLLDQLDRIVLDAGGRLYLAKDSRARPADVRTMYPRLSAFETARDRLDPNRVFRSDLSRRLGL